MMIVCEWTANLLEDLDNALACILFPVRGNSILTIQTDTINAQCHSLGCLTVSATERSTRT